MRLSAAKISPMVVCLAVHNCSSKALVQLCPLPSCAFPSRLTFSAPRSRSGSAARSFHLSDRSSAEQILRWMPNGRRLHGRSIDGTMANKSGPTKSFIVVCCQCATARGGRLHTNVKTRGRYKRTHHQRRLINYGECQKLIRGVGAFYDKQDKCRTWRNIFCDVEKEQLLGFCLNTLNPALDYMRQSRSLSFSTRWNAVRAVIRNPMHHIGKSLATTTPQLELAAKYLLVITI